MSNLDVTDAGDAPEQQSQQGEQGVCPFPGVEARDIEDK